MPETTADVVGNRILLRTPFKNLGACLRIPTARWDRTLRAWSYPATRLHANSIRKAFTHLEANSEFQALLLPPGPSVSGAAGTRLNRDSGGHPTVVLPAALTTRPWAHQVEAYSFAMELLRGGGGAMLALEMGTGKTLVALMVLAALTAQQTLISCPLRVVPVWQQQIAQHLRIPIVVSTLDESVGSVSRKRELAAEKMALAATLGQPFVGVINHDSVWREPFAPWAYKQAWDLVIVDESHKIKMPGGRTSKFFSNLRRRAARRLALSGTPMPHSPLDIYAQYRFLDASIFGPSFHAFKQRYAVLGGYQKKQVVGFVNQDEMNQLMRTIMFRVSKDVLDLPPEMHLTQECVLSAEAARIYRDLEEDFVAQVLGGTVTAANAMVKLIRLQQLTGGWIKTDDDQLRHVDTSKQRLLQDVLEDIGPQEPVVVFCRYHADLDSVHAVAKELGYESRELSGRLDQWQAWQYGQDGQVLAVQISAGGVGVDLTRARYSIYYSLSFSLGEYDQSLSRVHRPGQTRPVQHIHLVARDTVDQKIMRALEDRAEVINAILAEIKGARP